MVNDGSIVGPGTTMVGTIGALGGRYGVEVLVGVGTALPEASGVTVIGMSVGVAEELDSGVVVASGTSDGIGEPPADAAYDTPINDCKNRMPLRLHAMLFVINFFIFCIF